MFCEGKCQKWLHRHCAGISQPCFKLINETDAPFTCVYCLLIQQAAQINELRTTVKNLTTQIDTILSKQTSNVTIIQSNPSKQTSKHMELSANTTNTVVTEKSTGRSATPSESSNDRRFNIVIFGIPECDSGTSRFTRMAQDSANVSSTLQKIDSNLSESVVRD